ncbi:glycosyltransferase family 4 protein [Sphingomonas arantia]|uniref:Glycosyltransferase family 4 protein n=1 Tax=Sphingomonas arantia TaxID=1460676 RepID=A0ABW4U3W3_9SPHN
MQMESIEPDRPMHILLVAENISLRLSGETILPYHYLTEFLAAGHEVQVICHERVREDLRRDLPPVIFARVRFVADGWLQRRLFAFERFLPHRVQDLIVNQLIQILTQFRVRRMARALIAEQRVDVVFQPTPIAAKAVSALFGLGRPVVIGPMSGGMALPPAFRTLDGPVVTLMIRAARAGSAVLHGLIPGKRRAAALIVANERTRAALPARTSGRVYMQMESAVDLRRWQERAPLPDDPDGVVSFIFCGRFVDWKGIGYLVRAFALLARDGAGDGQARRRVRLDLVGDGELFDTIAALVRLEGLEAQVVLHGRLPIEAYVDLLTRTDVFVTPSLRECGGMAMMEAMATGLPVIGVDWAGAAQYAGPDCALLIDPASEDALVEGLAAAMRALADDAPLRRRLGAAARWHLEEAGLGWDEQARRVLAILSATIAEQRPAIETPQAATAVPVPA